jgi:hypothetical protein
VLIAATILGSALRSRFNSTYRADSSFDVGAGVTGRVRSGNGWVTLPSLPRTTVGEVDRGALSGSSVSTVDHRADTGHHVTAGVFGQRQTGRPQ